MSGEILRAGPGIGHEPADWTAPVKTRFARVALPCIVFSGRSGSTRSCRAVFRYPSPTGRRCASPRRSPGPSFPLLPKKRALPGLLCYTASHKKNARGRDEGKTGGRPDTGAVVRRPWRLRHARRVVAGRPFHDFHAAPLGRGMSPDRTGPSRCLVAPGGFFACQDQEKDSKCSTRS